MPQKQEISQSVEDEVNRRLAASYALIEAGQLNDAQEQLARVLDQDPNNAWAVLNLGVVMQRMGLHVRARELYMRVLSLPQAKDLVSGNGSQVGGGRRLRDLARHNLRSVNQLLQHQRILQERTSVLGANVPVSPDASVAVSVPAGPPPVDPEKFSDTTPSGAAQESPFDRQVLDAVRSWQQAWLDRRLEDYLAHYLPDFSPLGSSHAQWRQSRQVRLAAARNMMLELDGIQVQRLSSQLVRVVFRQSYRDARYVDIGCKTLVLQMYENKWKIRAEGFAVQAGESQCE